MRHWQILGRNRSRFRDRTHKFLVIKGGSIFDEGSDCGGYLWFGSNYEISEAL